MRIDFPYLGKGIAVPDRRTPRFKICFNTQGFDLPINWTKREKKLLRKGVDPAVIERLKSWDGSLIADWIDQAWEKNLDLFTACRGKLGDRARALPSSSIRRVTIMPSVFPAANSSSGYAAGACYPDSREMKVVNIYPQRDGWLRQAKDLLIWEIGNFFSLECGIRPEDPNGPGGRPAGWPCRAPEA